eukprot:7035663-Prymnesium_polylepis.1
MLGLRGLDAPETLVRVPGPAAPNSPHTHMRRADCVRSAAPRPHCPPTDCTRREHGRVRGLRNHGAAAPAANETLRNHGMPCARTAGPGRTL